MTWIPFFRGGSRGSRSEADQNRQEALKILEQTLLDKAKYVELYQEQKQVADGFREERRRNHFGELFQTAVPLRKPHHK